MATPEEIARLLMMQGYGPASAPNPDAAAMARALDPMIAPPRTSVAPAWLDAAIGQGVKHTGDWLTLPGRAMVPQQPETPGQWSDVDEARQQLNERAKADWGAQTGFGMVFDPLALAPKGVTVGAASIKQKPAEIIASPAARYQGDVYPSVMHATALEDIVRKTGLTDKQLGEALNSGAYADGYVTSSGRFVTRPEALAMAGDIGHGPNSVGTTLGSGAMGDKPDANAMTRMIARLLENYQPQGK